MTKNDEKLLAEFEIRMRQLMYLCDMLKDENTQMRQQLEQKEATIIALSSEVEELKTKYDNLKFVKSFSSENTDEREQARKRLSKLVRDVDKCITMLKV
jgi:phage shock protein A